MIKIVNGAEVEITNEDFIQLSNEVGPQIFGTPTLTKRQIIAALILGAEILDPDTAILGAIANITDPLEQALALNDWKNAPFYVRTHPLFNSEELLSTMGMTTEEVDVLWEMAKVLPQ